MVRVPPAVRLFIIMVPTATVGEPSVTVPAAVRLPELLTLNLLVPPDSVPRWRRFINEQRNLRVARPSCVDNQCTRSIATSRGVLNHKWIGIRRYFNTRERVVITRHRFRCGNLRR